MSVVTSEQLPPPANSGSMVSPPRRALWSSPAETAADKRPASPPPAQSEPKRARSEGGEGEGEASPPRQEV